jgi:hypothetical protein
LKIELKKDEKKAGRINITADFLYQESKATDSFKRAKK